MGVGYFALYYFLFRYFIRRFSLSTPGREAEAPVAESTIAGTDRARAMIAALGGAANLRAVDACTTRLRLTVADQAVVDEAKLRALGARGLVRPSANALQVVLGPIADQVAGELRAALRDAGAPASVAATAARDATPASPATTQPDRALLPELLAALGGRSNVAAVEAASTRVLLTLRDGALADPDALLALALRGIARPSANSVHLVVGPRAAAVAQDLRKHIDPVA